MWNRVVCDLPDTTSRGSYLGDLIQPEPGLIRAVCWVTFYNEYLMCLQGSGWSIWNVCNCMPVQMAASCVHVGSRFLLHAYCLAFTKPRCTLSTGYSADILCLGVVSQVQIHWKSLQSGPISLFVVTFISSQSLLCIASQCLFLLRHWIFQKFVENTYCEKKKSYLWISKKFSHWNKLIF